MSQDVSRPPNFSKAAWSSIEAWHHPLALSPAGSDPALRGGENPRMSPDVVLGDFVVVIIISSPEKRNKSKILQNNVVN